MWSIFEIELPDDKDPAEFVAFMEEEYLPAVHMGPTRVGQVEELRLLRKDGGDDDATSTEGAHTFLLVVTWSGLQLYNGADPKDEAVGQKFERFGATIKDGAAWREAASRLSER